MESAAKDNKSNHDDKKKSSNCPKCLSGNMVEHPSFLSIPLTSGSKIAERSKTSIEDQDADFVFKFISCGNCGYSEFYVAKGAARKRL